LIAEAAVIGCELFCGIAEKSTLIYAEAFIFEA
jgi:hypothetical protein